MKIFSFALLAGLAAPAVSAPPPIAIPVLVLADSDHSRELAEAFVTVLRERGYFARSERDLSAADFTGCPSSHADRAACIGKLGPWKPGGAAVVILASGTAKQRWTCIGIAAAPKHADRQSVELDLQVGLFGADGERLEVRNTANGCIIAAGAESGW